MNTRPKLLHFLHAHVKIPKPSSGGPTAGADFYAHVNGPWLRGTPMPPYASSFGVSEEVESYIDQYLLKEVHTCYRLAEKGLQVRGSEEEMRDAIGRMAMSALREGEQKHNVEYLKRGVRSLGCMRDADDIARTLGVLNRFGVPTILGLSVGPREGGDPMVAKDYQVILSPGSVGLPHVAYYSAVAPGRSSSLYAYTRMVQKVVELLELDDISMSIPFEAKLAAVLDIVKEKNDSNDMSLAQLERGWKEVPWRTMLEAYGVPKELFARLSFHVDSEEWLDQIATKFKEIPLESWYSLFSLHTVIHALPFLPPPFDDLQHSVFEKELRGQRKKLSQERLTLDVIKQHMPTALGYIFVKEHLPAEFRREATQFVESIVEAAAKHAAEVEWLSPAARRRAAAKVRAVRLSVAYSEPWVRKPARVPPLQTDIFLANIYLLESARTQQELGHLVRGAQKGEWDEPPYTVNAYYYHETNEMVVPAGSFFWPFFHFDQEKWLGWNYGGLGAIVGHELCHAFDSEGKEFDEKGRSQRWWSTADERAYEERTKELVRLFGAAKVLGRAVDGKATLNENLADLGGLGIALDALQQRLAAGRFGAAERERHLRDFFTAYAISWRTKEHPERRLQRLLTDVHAPIELRVNLVVSQFEEWYAAFGVRTADTLYRPPEERIRIF